MLFSILGTCVGADIILKKKNPNWKVQNNFVSYSPYALILGKNNIIDFSVNKQFFPTESEDHINKINNLFSGKIFKSLKKADYIIADLADFRISTAVLSFENNRKIYLTNGLLNDNDLLLLGDMLAKHMNSKFIPKINLIRLNELTDEQLRQMIEMFLESLYEDFDKDKIIFIKPKLTCQYLNNSQINYTQNFVLTGETNDMIDRVYNIAKDYIKFIEPPQNIIGDIDCASAFEYHFCWPYYNYMSKAINYIIENNGSIDCAVDKIRENCEFEIDQLIKSIVCKSLLLTIEKHINKKIVLIASTKIFESFLKQKYNKTVYEYIEYNKYSDISQIEEKISQLKSNDLIFVVPEIFNHGEKRTLFSVFYREFLVLNIDYFVYLPKLKVLDKFIGKFSDCYNNEIYVKQGAAIKIILNGCANQVYIDKQKRFFSVNLMSGDNVKIGQNCMLSGSIVCGYDAKIQIGKLTTISDGADIAVHSFSTILIGEDCMLSFREIIYSGDGHPIFIKENGQFRHINPCTDDKIEIGNHVWIGHSCKILGKTKIGDGSIVGMGSLVNKVFPNNVLIVGAPAKIIKKNVSWIRNVLEREIELDHNVYKLYANETVD